MPVRLGHGKYSGCACADSYRERQKPRSACGRRSRTGCVEAQGISVAPFVDLFDDPDAKVRLAAVQAFSSLSPNKEIASMLESLLNDPDYQMRAAARDLREHLQGVGLKKTN
jgi:hypothetical protein